MFTIGFNNKKIKSIEDDIRIIQNNDPDKANQLSQDIEKIKLENINLENKIPSNWQQLNDEYQIRYSSYSKILNSYYKSADNGYQILKDLNSEIKNTKDIENLIERIQTILASLNNYDSSTLLNELEKILIIADNTANTVMYITTLIMK